MIKSLRKVLYAVLVLSLFISFGLILSGEKAEIKVKAEEDVTASIEACNLAMQDNVYIVYAVKVENNTTEPEMLIWTNEDGDYSENKAEVLPVFSKETIEELGEGEFYTFVYNKLTAKQMTDNVYAQVRVDGVYSNIQKYSILQYAKNMKGKLDEKLENVLTNMLNYGASMQIYREYKTDRLANATFYSLTVVNGTLIDGTTDGLFTENETVFVTAPEEMDGKAFNCWKDGKGNVVDVTEGISLTEDTVLTAVYEENFTKPTFVVDNVNATAGKTDVTVNVSLKCNTGVASITVYVAYSSDLTLTGVTFNGDYEGSTQTSKFQTLGSPVKLLWVSADYSDLSDVFATLTFTVGASASGKYDLILTYDEDDVYDADYENVYFEIVNGSITVS